jgi:hypothetical protein
MKKVIFLFLLLPECLFSQRQHRPLHAESDYLSKGWNFGIGVTTMLPVPFRYDIQLSYPEAPERTYNGKILATPKAGWAVEANRHWLKTKFKYFDYWEVGGRYYCLRGMERYNGDYAGKSDEAILSSDRKTKFNLHTIGIEARAIDMWQFSDLKWLHHGPVFSVDYQFLQKFKIPRNINTSIPLPRNTPFPFQTALHYSVGIGKKVDAGLYYLLSLETPILTIVPWKEKWPTMNVMSTQWQPIWLTFRIMLLDKRPSKACENRPNAMEEIDKDDPGRHGKKDLFDQKVKRAKVRRRK